MDSDDLPRRRPGDLAKAIAAEDLDPLSVAELEARIAMLEGEIARCRAAIDRGTRHRASADALFR